MSKHHRHTECCNPMMGYGMYGYGMRGFGGAGQVGYLAGGSGNQCGGAGLAGGGIKWIYALLILIVVVLQFGRRENSNLAYGNIGRGCDNELAATKDEVAVAAVGGYSGFGGLFKGSNQLIDNSVLFIIVVFLLILCAGCFSGSGGAGFAAGGGYGSF